MDKTESLRLFFVTAISPVLALETPTGGFIIALVAAFAFNIFCGMRADGVSVINLKKFTFSKFKNSLSELALYLIIIYYVYGTMQSMRDANEAIYIVKTLSYVFIYCYTQNGFKNLIVAHPTNVALRVIYHVIRLEFIKAFPSNIKTIIDKYSNEDEIK